MVIGILTIAWRLRGCSSLKEKRQRIRGVKDKFGRSTNIAVCEDRFHNERQRASYTFVCAASNKKIVESGLAEVIRHCESNVDAELIDQQIEWL